MLIGRDSRSGLGQAASLRPDVKPHSGTARPPIPAHDPATLPILILRDDRRWRLWSPDLETQARPDADTAARDAIAVNVVCDPDLEIDYAEIIPDKAANPDPVFLAAVGSATAAMAIVVQLKTAARQIGGGLRNPRSDRADFPLAELIQCGQV